MATNSIESRRSAVDVDAALDEHRGRSVDRLSSGRPPRRWFAAVAAGVVVAGGITALAWPRGSESPDFAAVPTTDERLPQTTIEEPVPSTTVESITTQPETTTAPTSTAIGVGSCESEPLTPPSLADGTQPGDPVIEDSDAWNGAVWGPIDSAFAVSQGLGSPVDASWIDDAVAQGRAVTVGNWQAAVIPIGDPPLGRISIYLRNTDDGCLRQYWDESGFYTDEITMLAADWVTALATGEPVAQPDFGDAGSVYFAKRYTFEPQPLFFQIDEFEPSGEFVRTLADADVVALFGDRSIGGASPDGRYGSDREFVASDVSRWTVLDLDDGATPVELPSVCERVSDIVGPPRFVASDIVVVARICLPPDASDDPDVTNRDVQLEAIDLTAEQQGDAIVWSGSVPGLGVDRFSQSVDLSARQASDGSIWVIVSGNGDLEVSSQTYVLHDDTSFEITRRGYETFAFRPAELITEFDSLPR